ncbi:MAG: DMT family transporter [Candidatus Kerfeldbacteria bacterium]
MRQSPIVSATLLALATATISGFSNYIGKIGVTAVKDPLVFTTLKNAIVALLLVGIILCFKQWREIRTLTRKHWTKLIAIGIIGGSVPFALFFIGLAGTSALNASLIHKSLFLWVLLLAIPILKERMTGLQWAGIGLIAVANLFVGGFIGFKLNIGELMILGATLFWAIENIIAKVALKDISSTTVAAARMVVGSIVLYGVVGIRGGGGAIAHVNATQWGWTLLSSALLLGYVLTWYAALKRAPATYVATLLVPATLITNVLSALFITHTFPLVQFMNSFFISIGVVLVVVFTRRSSSLPVVSRPTMNQQI